MATGRVPGDDARRAHGAIEAVWRIESARLIAGLARSTYVTGEVVLVDGGMALR